MVNAQLSKVNNSYTEFSLIFLLKIIAMIMIWFNICAYMSKNIKTFCLIFKLFSSETYHLVRNSCGTGEINIRIKPIIFTWYNTCPTPHNLITFILFPTFMKSLYSGVTCLFITFWLSAHHAALCQAKPLNYQTEAR